MFMVTVDGRLAASVSADRGNLLYYVSIGDSLAASEQPDGSGMARPTDQGYSEQLYTILQQRTPNLALVKFGCGGETTTQMVEGGGRCEYARGSQLADVLAFLERAGPAVKYITVSLGANDALQCSQSGRIDLECAVSVLDRAPRNLAYILDAVRDAAGPGAIIAGMNLYNPQVSTWLQGPEGQEAARQSTATLAVFNQVLTDTYRAAGARVADVAAAFAAYDLDTMVELPEAGAVPLSVARVCAWTWRCVPPPYGPDIHPNATGYGIIAGAFADVILDGDGRPITATR
jgi:lysophospholipase L1-like esterase